jgi:hypothetical protein
MYILTEYIAEHIPTMFVELHHSIQRHNTQGQGHDRVPQSIISTSFSNITDVSKKTSTLSGTPVNTALQFIGYTPNGLCSYTYSVENISLWLILTGFVYIILSIFLLYILTTRDFMYMGSHITNIKNVLMHVLIMHTF